MNSFSNGETEVQGKQRYLPKALKPMMDWIQLADKGAQIVLGTGYLGVLVQGEEEEDERQIAGGRSGISTKRVIVGSGVPPFPAEQPYIIPETWHFSEWG